MKTYTYTINPGTRKFDDFKSTSNFINDYTSTSKSWKNSSYGIPVTTYITTKDYAPSWPSEKPDTKTTYTYTFETAKPKTTSSKIIYTPIYDIYDYTKDFSDYNFYTPEGEKVEFFDNFIKIGFDIIPFKKFNGFNIFKKKPAKKTITITFNIK